MPSILLSETSFAANLEATWRLSMTGATSIVDRGHINQALDYCGV